MTDVEALLEELTPSGYQRIVLPSGHVIPGRDLSSVAELVLPQSLEGKTVLDVGCYYGYFLHEAVARGAVKGMGLEPDRERFRVASAIAPMWNGKIEILQKSLDELDTTETFDYVLFLRVLHHVPDPIAAMERLAARCRDRLVVTFREPESSQFVAAELRDQGRGPSFLDRVKLRLRSRALRMLGRHVGLIGVGPTSLERTFFFNRLAFRRTFTVHRPLFKTVEFRRAHKPGLTVAECDCRTD